jgi:L-cysteine desulfidase
MDYEAIINLIKREVVPAVGCTEPMAVALCVAKAKEMLGGLPDSISVGLSANMLKNAMGVGIPGTGMIGLPIAVALGATIGKSEYELEVLKEVSPTAVDEAKEYMAKHSIKIDLAKDAPSKLYIDAIVVAGDKRCRAIISGRHTNFIYLAKGDDVLLDTHCGDEAEADSDPKLTLRMVYDFATQCPLEKLEFMAEAKRLNEHAAEIALSEEYGHSLGRTILNSGRRVFGDTPLAHMMAVTSAACDARMGGCPVAVMSNSGSGNQGITATMPVVSYAKDCGADHEHTIRALTLSNLCSIYIKQGLGRLSALCGCVVASTGASSGIAYLMGATYEQITAAVKNMVANLTGMICDGAKPSCAMKISSGVSTAMMSALLAMDGKCASSSEGIICDDVDKTIHNLTSIGKDAMLETDALVLNIMVNK